MLNFCLKLFDLDLEYIAGHILTFSACSRQLFEQNFYLELDLEELTGHHNTQHNDTKHINKIERHST
jgi:hypothetical protein